MVFRLSLMQRSVIGKEWCSVEENLWLIVPGYYETKLANDDFENGIAQCTKKGANSCSKRNTNHTLVLSKPSSFWPQKQEK